MTCAMNRQLNLVPEGGGIIKLAATVSFPRNPRTDKKRAAHIG